MDERKQMTPRTPHKLLDYLKETYSLKNDGELATFLGMKPPNLSRIRGAKYPVSADVVLRVHESTAMPIKNIMALL